MRTTEFSEQYGLIEPLTKTIESVDPELQHEIWNLLYIKITRERNQFSSLLKNILADFFRITIDRVSLHNEVTFMAHLIKPKFFILSGKRFYDLLHYTSKEIEKARYNKDFTDLMNKILSEKKSPCEFINYDLSVTFNEHERSSILQATDTPYTKVNNLIQEASSFLLEKDFIRCCESAIGAVESFLKNTLKNDNIDFSDAIDKFNIHSAQKKAMKAFWGYVSQCARHKTTDGHPYDPTEEDAKYVLVWCASSIEYLDSLKKAEL